MAIPTVLDFKKDTLFKSYDEFMRTFDEYCLSKHYVFVRLTGKTFYKSSWTDKHGRKHETSVVAPQHLKFCYLSMVCKRYGKNKPKSSLDAGSTRKRRRNTIKNMCPAKINLSATTDGKLIVLSSTIDNHNHETTAEAYMRYPEARRLSYSEMAMAVELLDQNMRQSMVVQYMHKLTGRVLELRAISNLVNKKDIFEHLTMSRTYSFIDVDKASFINSAIGTVECHQTKQLHKVSACDPVSCNCDYFIQKNRPCCHVFFLRHQRGLAAIYDGTLDNAPVPKRKCCTVLPQTAMMHELDHSYFKPLTNLVVETCIEEEYNPEFEFHHTSALEMSADSKRTEAMMVTNDLAEVLSHMQYDEYQRNIAILRDLQSAWHEGAETHLVYGTDED